MREYLELEFAPVKDKLVGFEYDFEKIIDDWVRILLKDTYLNLFYTSSTQLVDKKVTAKIFFQ